MGRERERERVCVCVRMYACIYVPDCDCVTVRVHCSSLFRRPPRLPASSASDVQFFRSRSSQQSGRGSDGKDDREEC